MRRKPEYLSPGQEAILSCIRRSTVEWGEAPTVREIVHDVGPSSTSSVVCQLRQPEKRGEISREGRRPGSACLGH
ncbi:MULTISPECIES: hypothetical protein [unclassified Streptomyces]